jgi:L-alanine-DL-glutamate epimerase-like enolase superfamily enzyme
MRISIDANSAWPSAKVAWEFLDMLKPFAAHICMVEQPFPLFRACPAYVDVEAAKSGKRMQVQDGKYVDLPDETVESWAAAVKAYGEANLPIYADESICSVADLHALRPLLHGVNIKMEKAGGYRGALKLMEAARADGVRVWLGSMVGSSPSSSQAAHLLPLATPDCWGDLDGSLLTAESSDKFTGGMLWTQDGKGSIGMAQAYGTACTRK